MALTADPVKDTSADCATKSGSTGDVSAAGPDVAVLAGEVFATAGGFELGLDLPAPRHDAGEGVSVMGVDEDPLTELGILGRRVDVSPTGEVTWVASSLAIASDGWTATSVPVSAEVELTNGGTLTIPVNSYHRRARLHKEVMVEFDFEVDDSLTIGSGSGSVVFVDESVSTLLESPVCVSGGCFMLVPDGGGTYTRDADGDLNLDGADKDDVSSRGEIVKASAVATVELTTDTNKDGVLNDPALAVVSRGIDKSSLRRGMVVTR